MYTIDRLAEIYNHSLWNTSYRCHVTSETDLQPSNESAVNKDRRHEVMEKIKAEKT